MADRVDVKDQKFTRKKPRPTFLQAERDDLALENESLFDGDDTLERRGLSFGRPPVALQDPDSDVGRVDAQYVSFVSAGGGVERIPHGLGRVPRRFVATSKSAATDVWRFAGTDWNERDIYLETTNAGVTIVVEIA